MPSVEHRVGYPDPQLAQSTEQVVIAFPASDGVGRLIIRPLRNHAGVVIRIPAPGRSEGSGFTLSQRGSRIRSLLDLGFCTFWNHLTQSKGRSGHGTRRKRIEFAKWAI